MLRSPTEHLGDHRREGAARQEVVHRPTLVLKMIVPPVEIRTIIEKLAPYVIRNGPSFEDKILEKERANPRFSFLYQNDPYHGYYRRRLDEYREVGLDGMEELAAKGRALERSLAEESSSKASAKPAKQKPSKRAIPKEPEPLAFLVHMPHISALDYDVIKLTAQYVARNGRPFMMNLLQREGRNPQFDFLKPSHSLHAPFLRLVNQYAKIILPPQELIDKLSVYGQEPFTVLSTVINRAEYVGYSREQKELSEKMAQQEREAYDSIDWHDFVIVEMIDFTPLDADAELPMPLEYSTIANMSLVQRKELWNGAGVSANAPLEAQGGGELGGNDEEEEAMDLDEDFLDEAYQGPAKRPAPVAGDRTLEMENGVRIIHDYVPKAMAAQSAGIGSKSGRVSEVASEICPMCSESIPTDQIAEHMRIEALDPKWKEQRDRHLAKHKDSNLVSSGVDVSRNLDAMARNRTAGVSGELND